MASVIINRGNTEEINNTPIRDGRISFNTEENEIYLDDGMVRKTFTGVNNLKSLNDVEISNPTDKQVIGYDAQTQKWKNQNATSALANLSDVSLSNIQNNDMLLYNGVNWYNSPSLGTLNVGSSINLKNKQNLVYSEEDALWYNSDEINYKIRNNWQGHGYNLIPYPYYDGSNKTDGGITYTVDSNGVIVANGTSISNSSFMILNRSAEIKLPQGWYKFNGCDSNAQSTTYGMKYYFYDEDDTLVGSGEIYAGSSFSVDAQKSACNLEIEIFVKSGQVLDNVEFKPLGVQSGSDDGLYNGFGMLEYERYAKSNVELTDEINDLTFDVKSIRIVNSLPSVGVEGCLYLCTT